VAVVGCGWPSFADNIGFDVVPWCYVWSRGYMSVVGRFGADDIGRLFRGVRGCVVILRLYVLSSVCFTRLWKSCGRLRK
jgi:hypothetical protein